MYVDANTMLYYIVIYLSQILTDLDLQGKQHLDADI